MIPRSADRKSCAEKSFRAVKNGSAQRGIELQDAEKRFNSLICNDLRDFSRKRRK